MSTLEWKVNTPQLLQEIAGNNNMWVLHAPLQILQTLLTKVAIRAIELDDVELNKLMLRLSLYEVANPKSDTFNQDFIEEYLNK